MTGASGLDRNQVTFRWLTPDQQDAEAEWGGPLPPDDDWPAIQVVDGKTVVLDGPYAESREQLGGYHLIEVPDLDAAIAWAARCPTALHGTVEVRPVRDPL